MSVRAKTRFNTSIRAKIRFNTKKKWTCSPRRNGLSSYYKWAVSKNEDREEMIKNLNLNNEKDEELCRRAAIRGSYYDCTVAKNKGATNFEAMIKCAKNQRQHHIVVLGNQWMGKEISLHDAMKESIKEMEELLIEQVLLLL